MKRTSILLVSCLAGWLPYCKAQLQAPIQNMISGGGVTGAYFASTTIPTNFGSIGQPMVLPRLDKTISGGGVMNAADIMFGSSTIDLIPPTITYLTSTLGDIKVNASDDKAVTAVKVFYRPITGTVFDSALLTLSGVPLYENTSLSSIADPMGLEFYFKAKDSRNETRDPVGTGTYYLYAPNPAAVVPAALLSYGTNATNYRIISVPYTVNGNANSVFKDLPAVDKTKYRLWQYDGGTWTEYSDFNTIDRGKGYFIIMNSTISTVALNMGPQTAPSNNRANLFTLPLSADWNLVGNPYTVPIDWDDVLTLNGNPAGVGGLNVYSASGYSNPTTLQPFEGAFVKVTGSAPANFKIGFSGQTSVGGRENKEPSRDISLPQWMLTLSVKQGDLQNSLGGIGMNPVANQGQDRFDGYSPPHMFDYVELISQRPELKVADLTKDIVETQSAYVWRFDAKCSTNESVELSWDNNSMGANSIPMFLYDVAQNEIVDMRQEGSYKFTPGMTKQFKVYYGIDRKEISPDELVVGLPYPNPFKESTEFKFALPGTNKSFEVELELMNSIGQRVKMVTKGAYLSGLHSVNWNGNGEDGEKVTGGLYYYRMSVDGQQSQTWSGRIIYSH